MIATLIKTGRFFRSMVFSQLSFSMLFIGPLTAPDVKPALKNSEQKTRVVEAPVKFTGVLYKSGNRQDPFLNPMLFKKAASQENDELPRGVPPPGIAGTYIEQAVLQGIVVREHGRIAVVRGADTRAYFLKEGDKLFDGYLKMIDSDSITLVRETKLRSGKILARDVIKRLRTP